MNLSYADLVQNFKAVTEKCNKAVERANQAIADKGCMEIELAGLRAELKRSYQMLADMKVSK